MAFDKNHTSLFMKVVIIVFAVVLVVSLCLPFFSGCTQASSQATDEVQTSSSGTASSTVESVEAQYSTLIESLEQKLDADPDSLAYLGNLGNAYMNSAQAMEGASDADSHSEEIDAALSNAIDYYDRYLAEVEADESLADQASVNAVTLKRILCQYQLGEEDEAVELLEGLLEDQSGFALGWYELGLFYEQQGDSAKAREAYNEAVEVADDASTTASLNAQIRLMVLDTLEAQEDESQDAAEGSADENGGTDDASAEGDDASRDDNEPDSEAE